MKSPPNTVTEISTSPTNGGAGSRWKWAVYLAIGLALLLTAKFFHAQAALSHALGWVGRLGPWGPVIFIIVYIAATLLLIPGSALTIGGGALFGLLWGSVYVSIGSTLGATGAFLLGRYLARDAIARKVAGNPRFAAIDEAVATEGWKIVGLTRLSPVFPFTLLNYAFGLTRISLRQYVLTSWICMMPGTLLYVYLGSLAKAAAGGRAWSAGEWTLYGVGLAATLLVTLLLTRMARRTLSQRSHIPS